MRQYLILLLLGWGISWAAHAQFVDEPILPHASYRKPAKSPTAAKTKTRFHTTQWSDTTTLPFVDDFSQSVLDTFLWMPNQQVFINHTFTVNPPTINVATLDGMGAKGLLHDNRIEATGYADTLTSRPIYLLEALPDVRLSFYYQAGGGAIQLIPNPVDSLLVQFKDKRGNWRTVWGTNWDSDEAMSHNHFIYQEIVVRPDTLYFHAGFQFRFVNFGRLSGNFDVWNIDYVMLKENRLPNNPIHEDIGFASPPSPLLKGYMAMPYQQFFENPTRYLNDTVSTQVSNFFGTPAAYQADFFIDAIDTASGRTRLEAQAVEPDFINALEQGKPMQLASYNQNFWVNAAPMVLEHYFALRDASPFAYRSNDTTRRRTEITDYFAYDDGSAEVVRGIIQAQVAYQFELEKKDTLNYVDICFPRALESIENRNFEIMVWSSLGNIDAPQDSILLVQQANVRYGNARDAFTRFELSRSLILPKGTFYVGVRTREKVGIGLDINTNSAGKTFISVAGAGWRPYIEDPFSLMIRPVFKEEIYINPFAEPIDSGGRIAPITPIFATIFPNPPAHGRIIAQTNATSVAIIDLAGKIMLQQPLPQSEQHEIEVAHLPQGIYIARFYDRLGFSVSKKLIIR